MSRGGYLGGSTVIYAGNRGWSYDPLETVAPPRGKSPKTSKASRKSAGKKKTGNDFLHDFAMSCACCKLYGVPWPKPDPSDPRYRPILQRSGDQFHKQFRNKVTHSMKAASRTLEGYFAQCASADRQGRSRPGLPRSIRFVTTCSEFIALLENEIENAEIKMKEKAITSYANACATKEHQGLKRPPLPDRLIRLFGGEVPTEVLDEKIQTAKESRAWVVEHKSKKRLSKPAERP